MRKFWSRTGWWTKTMRRWRKSWAWRHMRRPLIVFMVTVTVGALDILGIHIQLEKLSDAISQRVTAPIRGATDTRDRIKVVLIDPKFMNNGRVRPWPLAVNSLLKNIINPIAVAHPAAIFLDVSVTDTPRPKFEGGPIDNDAMEHLGNGLRLAGVPIYLSTALPLDYCGGKPWIDIDDLPTAGTTSARLIQAATGQRSNVEIVPAQWSDVGPDYPFAIMLASHKGNCLSFQNGAVPPNAGGLLLSPAAAIYMRVWCHSDVECRFATQVGKPGDNHGFGLWTIDPDLQEPMAVEWRNRVSEDYRRRLMETGNADRCLWQTKDHRFYETAIQLLRAFLPFWQNFMRDDFFERPCPYFDTFSAQDAADSSGDKTFQDKVKGRVVMIGTAIADTRDVVQTPFDVEVPGVYLHAMALQELIDSRPAPGKKPATGKPDYPRRPEGPFNKAFELFVEGIVVAFLGTVLVPWLAGRGDWLVAWCSRRHPTIWRIALFPLVLIPSSFLFFVIGLAVSLSIGSLANLTYFGSPFFIALVATMVMIEDLQAHYLGPALSQGHRSHH